LDPGGVPEEALVASGIDGETLKKYYTDTKIGPSSRQLYKI